ncbi:hypothetical protein FRC12_003292 [Ceratobasidium sp. 428]|nr:hypothetical protein FRC12_003292 [Ceratobasidium sp. 428]
MSASPSTASCWEQMSDAEISATISGEACWETGNINVTQHELYEAVQGMPTRLQSNFVNHVLVFATKMADASNHPLLQRRWQPGIQVGENSAANITNVLPATNRVAALFSAVLVPEQDPENKTRLTPEHLFPVLSFLEPNNIAKDDVMRWLFKQLRVLRRIATLLLSPYFQWAEQMRIMQDTWAHVRNDTALPLCAAHWMDHQHNHIQRFRSANLVPHAVERISLYAEPGLRAVIWQYLQHPNALLVLDANFGWITSQVNNLFRPRYNVAVQVLKADQLPPPYGGPDVSTDPD